MKLHDNSIIIIGAGFAGLAAGIYGRMNGYNTRIFEMHNQPGGLCASWKRKEYTFDGCIHWLVGSDPKSAFSHLWNETGISQGREFVYPEEYTRFEGADGRTVVFHANVDTLEKHLLELSPRDEKTIREFADGIRMCLSFDFPSPADPFFVKIKKQLAFALSFIKNKRQFDRWGKMTGKAFAKNFTDPLLRDAFLEIWIPEFSMLFMLFTFAYLHQKNAGYPIGGSKPMSEALESRYRDLGDDPAAYKRKKAEIGETAVSLLEQRFPGITALVEVIDVATPLTLKRYTGNWKGSFEGWLITPENAGVLMKPMRQTLPSLRNFYMCGQWVEPGGGLPTSIMSGRRLMKAICREDGIPFLTS